MTLRPYRTAALGMAMSLALAACVPPSVQRSPAETAASQQAASLAKQGQFDQAALAYLDLARLSPDNRDAYQLQAAEAYRQEGKLDQAASLIDGVKRSRLSGTDPVLYDLLQAEIALSRHDGARALQLTTQPNVAAPAALQLRLLELRARAMEMTGDYWGAARTRVEMDGRLTGLDNAQNRKQAIDLMSRLGADQLKQRAGGMRPGDHMLPWINEALGHLGVAVAHPQPALDQPVGTLVPGEHANVREGYKMPSQIALLLPASGNYSGAGSVIREGFFAGYADAARNHAPRAQVRVYDSGGTAAGATKAYQQAVDDGAQLVIGPLTRPEVAAVFGLSQLPVPVLALNHPDDKALPASGASEFGLLPETEGAQAADHMADQNLRSAYTIVTGDDFAQRAATAFKAEFQARGGTIASSTTLGGGVNYASNIAGLNATSASTDAGIFISMRPQQARLLLPQLRLAKINLPVYGTSHIYAGEDDAADNRDLEGVEFTDAPWLFDAQPGLPSHQDIINSLPSSRGVSARLFAFGMDAWNLAPYLDWLHAHPGSYLPGASGQLTADQFGRIRRVLVWAKFQDGIAHPLNGSLQMDNDSSGAPANTQSTPAPASSAATH